MTNPSEKTVVSGAVSAVVDSAETMGTIFQYDSQLPVADIPGTRIVTCCYKQTDKMKEAGIEARANVYYRVPTTHLTDDSIEESLTELSPFILTWLRGVEDKHIKKYHKEGGQQLYTDNMTLARVMGILEETGNGGSIDGEQITKWFTENMADKLTEHLCVNKLDIEVAAMSSEVRVKVTAVVNGFLASFISLASGRTVTMIAAQRAELINAMKIADTLETVMGQRFTNRFNIMAAKELAALESLGVGDELSL